jgi:hypothetical protein
MAAECRDALETLLAEAEAWCDQERGRRTELSIAIGVSLPAISTWFREYKKAQPAKQPTGEQVLAIQEFLARHRQDQKWAGSMNPQATAWKTLSILLASFAAMVIWRDAARHSLGIDLLEQRLNLCERMLIERDIRWKSEPLLKFAKLIGKAEDGGWANQLSRILGLSAVRFVVALRNLKKSKPETAIASTCFAWTFSTVAAQPRAADRLPKQSSSGTGGLPT